MKKIILILVMMLFGTSMMFAQSTETGYVTVTWTEVTPCCVPMKYYVCITIMRVSDRICVVENLCEILDLGNDQYKFEFEFPCSTSNEEFQIFATFRAGCEGSPPVLCDYGKNPGEFFDCGELTSGGVTIVSDYDY